MNLLRTCLALALCVALMGHVVLSAPLANRHQEMGEPELLSSLSESSMFVQDSNHLPELLSRMRRQIPVWPARRRGPRRPHRRRGGRYEARRRYHAERNRPKNRISNW